MTMVLLAFAVASIPASVRAQSSGALRVTSFPSGAKVSIDGVDTGKVTPMSVSVSVGDHLVEVSIPNSGWNPDTRTVTIVSGNNDLSVTLLPVMGTRAAGPCFDSDNRYVDCGNGTVTDTVTGLIWLKQSDCLGSNNWDAANQAAAGLKDGDCTGLTDRSSPGDWRLPTKAEWEATTARAAALLCTNHFGSEPTLTNDAGTACYITGPSSFAGVVVGDFWSSTSVEDSPNLAWRAYLYTGGVVADTKDFPLRVWPVRGGSR
jgi:hypothetical protein